MTVEERSVQALVALMNEVARSAFSPASSAFQYVVGGTLSEHTVRSFVAMYEGPEGQRTLELVARAAIREYLRRLCVDMDECQQINGEVLVVGVGGSPGQSSVSLPKGSRDYFGALVAALAAQNNSL